MKLFTLLVSFACLCCGTLRADTISGVVSDVSNCTRLAGQKVYVKDSTYGFLDSTITNSDGSYSLSLPTPFPTATHIVAYINVCGSYRERKIIYSYSGGNITANLFACGTPPWITGRIQNGIGSMNISGPTMVYLIKKQYDAALMDSTLTAIDSVSTENSFHYLMEPFPCITSGTLLLKAVMQPTHPDYATTMPTYFGRSLTHSGATALTTSHYGVGNDILMITGTNPGGPGFIGGSVLQGANKSTAVGDPLNHRILLLTTAADMPVAFTYSDAAGNFSFPPLAYGSYKLFGDALGKSNPPLFVTIDAAKPGIYDIVFEENNKSFKARSNVHVASGNSMDGIRMFPNPARNYLTFTDLDQFSGIKEVTVRNFTGAVLLQESFDKGKAVQLNTTALPSGTYLVLLQTEKGRSEFRLVK